MPPAGAALAAGLVCRVLALVAAEAEITGRTWEERPDGTVITRHWAVHPRCGCQAPPP
jgi:hypothetical protein